MGDGAEPSEYWQLPADLPVVLVDEQDQLEQWCVVLTGALACALDAEWPPEETAQEARSGGPPHATLVQLAAVLPPGAGGLPGGAAAARCGADGCACCVLLLDLLRLPQAPARRALQALFRAKGCLKLGFGLSHDLRAIGAALGAEGGGCVAVVEPACDVGSVHRFLRHRGVRGARKAVDLGLSGLVAAQLGRPLDKSLQCSAWGERPLSAAQRRYAAADAACLLALLGCLMAAVGRPEEWPMVEREEVECVGCEAERAGGEGGEAERGGSGGSGAAGDEGAGGTAGAAAAARHDRAAAAAARQASAADGGWERRGAAAPGEHAAPPQPCLLGGCSLQQLRAAAAAWGARLEVSGSRVSRGARRASRGRRTQRQAAAAARKLLPGCLGVPRHIPWMDAQRRLTGAPAFLCDVMCEGLARQLRLCGYDAESLASMEKAPRHAVYRAMAERGEVEGRLVLTTDRSFVGAAYSDQALLVGGGTKRQQLEQVLGALALTPRAGELLTRCSRCNGEFLPEPRAADALPAGHAVPPGILAQHAEFWECARCSGVFWQGTQYQRAVGQMTELMQRMGRGGAAAQPPAAPAAAPP